MNKQKTFLILAFIIVALVSIVLFIQSQSVVETQRLGNGKQDAIPSENTASTEMKSLNHERETVVNTQALPSTRSSILSFKQDLKSLRQRYPDGVLYITLAESNLPKSQKEALAKEFDNLNRYGSFSGGKITHEFSHLDKKRAALKQEKALDFVPTNTDNLLPGMDLTGKWYSGAINEGKYNSLYRLYEGQGEQKLEITEMYLNPNNSSIVEVYKESLNYNINNVPMTIETLKTDNNADIYNVHFNYKDRYYSLSTLNLSRNQVETILTTLTQP
ncbi:hypothetical protein [Acinetobacter courvalinii]|uniref:hypothetical protein n=1 Tax=Acinetobacter courvalinii TaxID=280147 RepID=UPI00289C9873|nr:hypothetical protein [Acinetobacter courvalinii]